MIWYSLSVSVCAGATVIESPVCTPIGSRFSIEQTMMQLSLRSRTTSISNSFQPITDSSISTSCVGLASRPRSQMATNSSGCRRCRRRCRPSVNDGPDDRREAHHRLHLQRLLQAVRERGARAGEPDLLHRLLELLAVLGLVDRLALRADHLDAVLLEHAVAREVERAVERGLPAHRRQQRVGALDRDDLLHHLPVDRLDVGRVRHLRVGHDGGRIGVDQDDAVALLPQRLARLRARNSRTRTPGRSRSGRRR